jgi:acetyl-CoA synthetase
MKQSFAWTPTDEIRTRARLTTLLRIAGCDNFEQMHQRSVQDVAGFTEIVLRYLGVEFHRPYEKVLDLSKGPAWPAWCRGGGLNIARSCLKRADRLAVSWEGEEGERRALTYQELAGEVARFAGGLRAIGVGVGDAVGLHLPMTPEAVVALIAIAQLGAIAVPLFSGFGPAAIESRMRDVGAKAIITCDGFPRRGRLVRAKLTVDEAVRNCPTVQHVVVTRRSGVSVPMHPGRDLFWTDLMSHASDAAMEQTGAEDPLIIIYTSGTTGRPKGIVHTHCGFPVKSAQDMAFNLDAGPGDRVAWITDIGWMMGPWLIYGALLLGATIVLYDGAPDFPSPDRLWRFAADHQVSVLGLSPTLVRALIEYGTSHATRHSLPALRILGSTGEPWNPDPWWWLFEHVARRRIPIINYSGGTECSGGILGNNVLLPIKPCALAAPCLGMDAAVMEGELVIRKPWIGQARGFWKDAERYMATYWSRWPDVWLHGDWAQVDDDGHWFITGRSDDTLKIAGKRVGPAEVESVLVNHPHVREAVVIGVPDERKGTAMVAFCIASQPGYKLAEELRQQVGEALGKPLQPERVHFLRAIPKTRNAKIMRRVVRAVYLGEDPGDLTALDNPDVIDEIKTLRGSHAALP